ncbi:MAG TPA: type I phosphomannose isomerase catalytic subunit [Candidatus Dormibacteraeota bacterium]|nr:type I phosphomannose isomerase catalytic subunit [Candidatus Dormibacteraeota bacterium]
MPGPSTRTTLAPLRLDPVITPAIWGGDALARHYGKAADPHAHIGESWECWEGSRVAEGPYVGATIADLHRTLGERLLGDIDPHRPFPILTKFIDARDWLSVQVHPTDAYAQRVEQQPFGKTESWFVLHAEPNAEIVLGWTKATSRDEYERRVADGTLGELLRRVPVKTGDAFYLPAGTLHAIGPGIVVYETQQSSDLTYRIFDWNRMGSDGKPRELHVGKAADVLDFRADSIGALATITYPWQGCSRTALISDENFTVERLSLASGGTTTLLTQGRPAIVTALGAPLDLAFADGSLHLAAYQSALLPAEVDSVTSSSVGTTSFLYIVPTRTGTLAKRMHDAGIADAPIAAYLAQFAPAHIGS